MPESVENWWSRRQASKDTDLPYPVGTYRVEWERFPILIRQFHPDLNGFIMLTQIPPAADVYLLWQCDSGHRFVATPSEQRNRPGGTRRRSTWCPECTEQALGNAARHPRPPTPSGADGAPVPRPSRADGRRGRGRPVVLPRRRVSAAGRSPGSAFVSAAASKPASVAESRLRAGVAERLDVDLAPNAVAVRRPFFERFEVWPDLVIPELMLAIEYDTTGRTGTEHVGERERSDRAKDRLLREVGWEVVRIRTSRLQPIGPFDVLASGVTGAVIDRVIERAGEIRGELIVASYARSRDQRRRTVPDVGLEPTRPEDKAF